MEVFSRFLTEHYGMSFSMEDFRTSYMAIWKKNKLKNLTNTELVKHLFRNLLKEGAFECKIPHPRQLCPKYCKGETECCSCIDDCQGNIEHCKTYTGEYTSGNYYDPYELLMDNQNNSAILIKNTDRIYGFPKYKQLSAPLFIVGRNNLINMLNNALEKFCMEMNTSHDCFGPKEISSLLNKNGMCTYRITGDHPCYTFPYSIKDPCHDKTSVYILRIDRQELDLIYNKNQKASEHPSTRSYLMPALYNHYPSLPKELIRLVCELQWRVGNDFYTKDKYTEFEQ